MAEGVLFANQTLIEADIFSAIGEKIDFGDKKRFGIGYYPINQAEKIAEKKSPIMRRVRSEFLMKNGIEDTGQKVLVYFGGNNEEYFTKAFPAFLSFIAESSEENNPKDITIVIQQHPGAKAKNQDGRKLEAWLKEFGDQPNMPKVIVSDFLPMMLKCSPMPPFIIKQVWALNLFWKGFQPFKLVMKLMRISW